jgi:hypothetical protein
MPGRGTEVQGENLPQHHFVRKSQISWTGLGHWQPRWEIGD